MKIKEIKYGEHYASSDIFEINLSDIEEIGESAFASSSITTINGIARNIKNFAFSVCEKLKGKIVVSGKKIGRAAFERCPLIEEVVFMDEVKEIDSWAFDECKSLTQITFPHKLESIGEEAFHEVGIKILDIGEIDTIAENAFSECKELQTVNIQRINKFIKSNSFSKCSNLKNITYNGQTVMNLAENEKFKGICVVDDKFFIKYDKVLQNDNGEITTISHILPIEVDLPIVYGHEKLECNPLNHEGHVSSKTRIPDGIFRRCQTIKNIILDRAEDIGNNAFDKCSNLTSISLSPNLKKIGQCAFQDSGIESVDLSNTRRYCY